MTHPTQHFPTCLTIAGSDSGGGAGIQADLKTFQALGCYGMSVITAVTAQNTKTVSGIFALPYEFVGLQLKTIFEDFKTDALKIGMLHDSKLIEVVANSLKMQPHIKKVLDPVMVAKSGDHLLQPDAVDSLKNELFGMVDMVTPNLPEASILCGRAIETEREMELAADELLKLCPQVVIKGGHLAGGSEVKDFFASQKGERQWIVKPRIQTRNNHGTGCTFSAAIAAGYAKGQSSLAAVISAHDYLHSALASGTQYKIGHGHGPVNHGWKFLDGDSK